MNGDCRVLLVAGLVGAVVGCTSAPVRYYTLTPPPDVTATAAKTGVAIDVRVLHTPPQLNRTELMVRKGPSEMVLLDNERWASPLKDEIRDALRLQLERRLGAATDLPSGISRLTVSIDVQHLEAELGRHALMEASWGLSLAHGPGADEGQAANCTFDGDEKIAAGYAAMASGYQRDIAALADAVVMELKRRMTGIGAPCGQTSGS